MDANIVYYCLHKLHWHPREYLNSTREEQAIIIADIQIKADRDEKERRRIRYRRRK